MDNPYLTAGFGLMATGAVLAGTRTTLTRLLALCQRRYLTTVEVSSRDPVYRWLTAYLSSSPLVVFPTGHHHSLQSLAGGAGGRTAGVLRIPAPGTHYFKWHSRHWFRMERSRDKQATTGTPEQGETIVLTCVGRQSQVMEALVGEVLRVGEEERKGRLPVYTAFASEWRLFGEPRKPRPLESVVLKRGVMEGVVADITRFQTRESWYTARGIPYRRGYLLHGPPGCGKSSAIQAIAGCLGYGLAVLSLADRHISDDRLAHLINNMPPRCILLLEDIDTVAPTRQLHAQAQHGLSLSGLLNAVDGAVAGGDERIIMMTSNDPGALDAALVRPGRVDVSVEIGVCDAEQAERMFSRFHPVDVGADGAPADADGGNLCRRFGRLASGRSPASLQGLLIDHPDNPDAVLQALLSSTLHSSIQPPKACPNHNNTTH